MKRREMIRNAVSAMAAMLLPRPSRCAEATADAAWRHIYIDSGSGSDDTRVFVDGTEAQTVKHNSPTGTNLGLWVKMPNRKGVEPASGF